MPKTLDRVGPFRTKADEVEFLKDLVARLPSSYLRDVLSPFLIDFEQGVYSDWVPAIRDSWDARVAADKEVKAVNAELAALRQQKRTLEASVSHAVGRLEELAKLARQFSGAAHDVAAKAKSLEGGT